MSFLISAASIAGFVYVGAPLLIKAKMKTNASPNVLLLESSGCPEEVARYFETKVPELMLLGFEVVGYYSAPDMLEGCVAYFSFLFNYRTQDKAMIASIVTKKENSEIRSCYTEFSTRFTDGTAVTTSNIATALAFRPVPTVKTTRLPGVEDCVLLYRVHRMQMEIFAPDREKLLPEKGKELNYLIEVTLRSSNEKQCELGILSFDAESNCYRATWIGAYYMTWKLLFPAKQIELEMRKRNAREVLKQLDTYQWKQDTRA